MAPLATSANGKISRAFSAKKARDAHTGSISASAIFSLSLAIALSAWPGSANVFLKKKKRKSMRGRTKSSNSPHGVTLI